MSLLSLKPQGGNYKWSSSSREALLMQWMDPSIRFLFAKPLPSIFTYPILILAEAGVWKRFLHDHTSRGQPKVPFEISLKGFLKEKQWSWEPHALHLKSERGRPQPVLSEGAPNQAILAASYARKQALESKCICCWFGDSWSINVLFLLLLFPLLINGR